MGISRLAAFFFMFQVSLGLVSAMNVFPAYNMTQSTGYDTEVLKYNTTNLSYITAGVEVSAAQTYGWGDYLWSMIRFISLIFGFVAGIYGILLAFGFDPLVAGSVQLIAWYTYAEAIVGFVRGHSMGGY